MNLNAMIKVYRQTLKKVPGLHRLLYTLGEGVVIPLLEKALRFRTPTDDPLNFRLKLLLNQWEPETVAFFKKVVRRGDHVLDIGAHVGYYTRLFAKLVGPSGRVVAVEPHPKNFQLLKANTQGLTNVTLMNVAAAEKEGEIVLYDASDNTGSSSLRLHQTKREFLREVNRKEIGKRMRKGLPVREYKVTALPLDKGLPNAPLRIAKIDIEGAECLAIMGMEKTMSKLEILVFELDRGNLETLGFKPGDLVGLIESSGLTHFYLLDRSKAQPVSGHELQTLGNSLPLGHYINVAATRRPL